MIKSLQVGCPLRVLRQPRNKGPAAARNVGASAAKGEYIFFFDSDKEAPLNSIDLTLKEMKRLKADAITGIYHWEPLNKGYVPEYKAIFNYYFFSRKGIIPYEVFDSSRACVKKEVFYDLGGFNDSLEWGMDYENEELGYRLVKKYKNFLVPSFFVRHHFPNYKKLTKTYFFRVAYWAKIFSKRKKFESGGITSSDMGIGTACILPAIVFSPLLSHEYLFFLPVLFFLIYIKTFLKFFLFCFKEKGYIKGTLMIALNMHYSLIISLGFVFGILQGIFQAEDRGLLSKS